MNYVKLHRKLKKKFKEELQELMPVFFDQRNKKKCNTIIRDHFPKLYSAIEKDSGLSVYKTKPAEFHTILTGDTYSTCANEGCSNRADYDNGKRKFKEFCSKSCANASGVIRIRREATMLAKYGVVNAYSSPEIQKKIRKKNLKNYGTENPSSNAQVKAKRRNTFQERFGVNSPMESESIKAKHKALVREKYGVENIAQSDQAKRNSIETCKKRYGVSRVMHCPSIAAHTAKRSIEGSMAKYGVPNAMLHPDILSKWQDALGRRTAMKLCGKTIFVQGYEQFVFEKLYARKPFASITTTMPEFAMVKYTYEGKQKRYIPDAAIKMIDGSVRVVEVKSWFTLKAKANVEKFKAATKHFNNLGMDFVLIIAEPENDYLKIIINPKRKIKSLVQAAELFCTGRRSW